MRIKSRFFAGISVFLFFLSMFLPHLNAYTEDIESILYDPEITISLDLQNADLKDVMKIFSIQSGLNFIASEAVQDRRLTLYLDKVPLEDAMNKIFSANNLTYELDPKANIFIVKDWGKPGIEMVTRVFYLKYASVSESPLKTEIEDQLGTSGEESGDTSESDTETEDLGLLAAITSLLSNTGSVIEDDRTNSLIITDTPKQMEIIAKVIVSLDIPMPQVMLEVEMLDVNKGVVDKLGLNWADAGSFAMTIVSAARMTGFPLGQVGHMGAAVSKVTNSSVVGGSTDKFNTGEISFPSNLAWVFDFLRTQTDTKILARPRIMTLNNKTAEILVTTNESIGTVQTASSGGALTTTTTEAERTETGVSLRITPQINIDSGEITMFLMPSVKNAAASTTFTSGTTRYLDPSQRTTKSVVRIKDGETVVLGGLISHDVSEIVTKIPFLGDIPLLGNFFRHKYKNKDTERELLVFITPHIVKDTQMKLAQAGGVSLPDREQAADLADNRESLINSSLKRFEKKK